jgi:hypothetical protein
MFDQDKWKAIQEHVGTEVAEGAVPDENFGPATDALWRQWIQAGSELQDLGIAPTAMCDATNEIAAARAKYESAEHQAASQR